MKLSEATWLVNRVPFHSYAASLAISVQFCGECPTTVPSGRTITREIFHVTAVWKTIQKSTKCEYLCCVVKKKLLTLNLLNLVSILVAYI